MTVGGFPSSGSKWRWAFVCGLSQRADLNGALVSVSLHDIRTTCGQPETRCKASRYPADYLQSLRWGVAEGWFSPQSEFRDSEVTLIRRKHLRIFAVTEWGEAMEEVLRRDGSEGEEDTQKLETQLRSLRVGVCSGSDNDSEWLLRRLVKDKN